MIDVDGGHQPDRSDAARAPWNPCNAGQPQTQNLSLMEAVRLQFALRLLSVETRRIRLGPPASDIWGSELRTLQWPLRNTGTVHISKRQYPPNQLQAVQVLRSSFCSSWLRRLQVNGWGRDKPRTAAGCAYQDPDGSSGRHSCFGWPMNVAPIVSPASVYVARPDRQYCQLAEPADATPIATVRRRSHRRISRTAR